MCLSYKCFYVLFVLLLLWLNETGLFLKNESLSAHCHKGLVIQDYSTNICSAPHECFLLHHDMPGSTTQWPKATMLVYISFPLLEVGNATLEALSLWPQLTLSNSQWPTSRYHLDMNWGLGSQYMNFWRIHLKHSVTVRYLPNHEVFKIK